MASLADFKIPHLLLIVFLACTGVPRYNSERITDKIASPIVNIKLLDSVGPSIGEGITLTEPADIAVNDLGEIYVSDRGSNKILKLSDELKFVSFEGGIGNAPGDFNRPLGLDCDAAMNLYIADSGNRRIQILDRSLRRATVIDGYFGKDGSSRKLDFPADVAVDLEGNTWIADDDKILKLNPFAELDLELSYSSEVRLNIAKAACIAASRSGLIAIGDSDNRKVFVVTAYGNLISEFAAGSVSSLAWEGENVIWIADQIRKTVAAYDISGNLLFIFSGSNIASRPVSALIDNRGMLLVIDGGVKKISRYEIIRDKIYQPEK